MPEGFPGVYIFCRAPQARNAQCRPFVECIAGPAGKSSRGFEEGPQGAVLDPNQRPMADMLSLDQHRPTRRGNRRLPLRTSDLSKKLVIVASLPPLHPGEVLREGFL